MGAAHPDPEIRGRLGLEKIFFRTFRPQFGLKIGVRGGGGVDRVPRTPPLDTSL